MIKFVPWEKGEVQSCKKCDLSKTCISTVNGYPTALRETGKCCTKDKGYYING